MFLQLLAITYPLMHISYELVMKFRHCQQQATTIQEPLTRANTRSKVYKGVQAKLETMILDQGRQLTTLKVDNFLPQLKVKDVEDAKGHAEDLPQAYRTKEQEYIIAFDGQDKQTCIPR